MGVPLFCSCASPVQTILSRPSPPGNLRSILICGWMKGFCMFLNLIIFISLFRFFFLCIVGKMAMMMSMPKSIPDFGIEGIKTIK